MSMQGYDHYRYKIKMTAFYLVRSKDGSPTKEIKTSPEIPSERTASQRIVLSSQRSLKCPESIPERKGAVKASITGACQLHIQHFSRNHPSGSMRHQQRQRRSDLRNRGR